MRQLAEAWIANRDFLEVGRPVLMVIIVVTFAMWTLILERYWYLHTAHRRRVAALIARWKARRDKTSWQAGKIRLAGVSQVSMSLNSTIPLIQALVALCPLLGLLGTVTGMVEVFEAMAIAGSANARAMASGVSRATIPTMAGMVAAISGFIFSVQLERRAENERDRIADQLRHED